MSINEGIVDEHWPVERVGGGPAHLTSLHQPLEHQHIY